MAEAGYKVLLHVYDLSQGLAKELSSSYLGKSIEGVWHTGVVVFGSEYYFGGSVQSCPPGRSPYGRPLKVVELGYTQILKERFENYLQEIKPKYSEETYSVLHHNCNNFSEEVAQFLVGVSIPEYILKLPEEVLNSPTCDLIMPWIQQVETTLRYGGVVQVPPLPNLSVSSIKMNGSNQEVPSNGVSMTTFSTEYASVISAVPAAFETAKLPDKKEVDTVGEVRTQVQEEVSEEIAGLMAEGHLRASEAAAVATR